MKKNLFLIAVILGITVIAFTVVFPAFAAGPAEIDRGGPGGGGGSGGGGGGGGNGGGQGGATTTDSTPSSSVMGKGNGNQGGTGTGVPVNRNISLDGAIEEAMHDNLATALGLTPEELAARLDAGETISNIAISLGFDVTEVRDIVTSARTDALAQAVVDGLITQEEADWLASHGYRGVR